MMSVSVVSHATATSACHKNVVCNLLLYEWKGRTFFIPTRCFEVKYVYWVLCLVASSCVSVRPSVCMFAWNSTAPNGRISIKFGI